MELNIFMRELESALVKRGIPDETALKHVSNLRRSFTSDDLSEIEAITSGEEVEQLAESIAVILNKNKKNAPRPQTEARDVQLSPQVSVSVPRQERISSTTSMPKKKPAKKNVSPSVNYGDDYYDYSAQPVPSTKGMLVFWIGLFVTLPISLGILVAIFGAFAAVFVGLAAVIVAGIAVLIALVAAGAGVSLIGIIFGITQLFSFFAAGIYEIGLGVMVAGAVLFVAVLIYNFSIRLIPWLITQVGNLLGFVCRKLKSLFFIIRRECYKL